MAHSSAQFGTDVPSGQRALILTIIAAIGLVLAMAASTRSWGVGALHDVARRLIIALLDRLVVAVLTKPWVLPFASCLAGVGTTGPRWGRRQYCVRASASPRALGTEVRSM